ncbi:hypothetical protein [Photobacterium sp. TY1-4]|uniref:hypothetical protein n=1 Tax=Photobacterium sp. TY1-4 TaxID=2899122 RepID=UPI0021C081F4|nr:hypothetical protein [Photobacterium sp. TY1-4]UXH99936.1 hypothetical protein NH461_08805 [Photobacterium sp. TY1-4]
MKQDIVTVLVKNDSVSNLADYFYSNPVEKYSLRLAILFAFISLPLIYFDIQKEVAGWLSLIAGALFILYSIASFVWNLRYIAMPTRSYFIDLQKRIESEEKLIKELSAENSYQLDELLRRLNFERERLRSRVGFLIGAIDKLGLFPAILALYLTYVKTTNDISLDNIPYPLLSFIVGIYVGCFLVKSIIDRIEHMCLAVEISKERSTAVEDIRNNALTRQSR